MVERTGSYSRRTRSLVRSPHQIHCAGRVDRQEVLCTRQLGFLIDSPVDLEDASGTFVIGLLVHKYAMRAASVSAINC